MQGAWTKWAPDNEKTRLVGAHFCGGPVGTFLVNNLGGIIIGYFSWAELFYFCAASNLIWLLLWSFLVFDSPEDHKYISDQERAYIITNRSNLRKNSNANNKQAPPYLKIFTSG